MKDKVLERLDDPVRDHDIEIINAHQRGSQMMGVDHDDSDCDVLFLFAQEGVEYAKIHSRVDSIHDPDEPVDLHGWNVDKFGELAADSNPNAIEYCRPDATEFVSFAGPEFEAVADEVRENFNHMSLYNHYISMAKSNYKRYVESGVECTRGKQFYVLRAIAMAKYIRTEGELPPMDTYDLIDETAALGDEEHDHLLVLADSKTMGKGEKDNPDIVGDYLEAESEVPMEPTEPRINTPDEEVIDNFIEEAVRSI